MRIMKIPYSILTTIDWEGIEIAMHKTQPQDRFPRMKLMHYYLPTKSLLHERYSDISPQCPRCSSENETFLHVFQCQCSQAKTSYTNNIKKFREKLQKLKTSKLIIDAFEALLLALRRNTSPIFPTPLLRNQTHLQVVQQVFEQQSKVGLDSVVRGFLVRNWMVAHNVCSHRNNIHHRDLPWIKNVICALLDFGLSIWKERCTAVNDFSKDNPLSMQSNDLLQSIKQYINIPKSELSTVEKALHTNISRIITKAHQRTLARWLILLRSEREATIRRKRENRRLRQAYTRPITDYFQKKSRTTN